MMVEMVTIMVNVVIIITVITITISITMTVTTMMKTLMVIFVLVIFKSPTAVITGQTLQSTFFYRRVSLCLLIICLLTRQKRSTWF